jgi:glycosyltransferase involved in cell wall biosynthesis
LPAPDLSGDLLRLPPILHPNFIPQSGHKTGESVGGSISESLEFEQLDLPETYILYHGPLEMNHLAALIQAWKWASGPISDSYPLLILGVDGETRQMLKPLAQEFDLWGSIDVLTGVSAEMLPHLYWRSAAVVHPAPASPWSGPVRLALACGRPLVAYETALIDAIVGPAAYLVPSGDTRALGAGVVTVVVEEQVAERLSQAARQRSANWRNDGFGQELLDGYTEFLD